MTSNNYDAELSVIGSLMLSNEKFDDICDTLTENDFHKFENKILFRTIVYLATNNQPFDMITMADVLKKSNELETIGGEIVLFELAKNTPSSANIKAYAEIVKRTSLDRKLIKVAGEIITSVQEQDENRIDSAQRKLEDIAVQKSTEIVLRANVISEVLANIDDRRNQENGLSGLPTSFKDLDKMTAGLQKGDLIILGARPSQGKTSLMLNIADYASIFLKKSVIVFTLEMSKEQLIERTLASLARVNMHKIKSGELTAEESAKIADAARYFTEDQMIIDDTSSVGVNDIRAKCRKVKRERGLDLVVVDYIGLMSGDGENENLRIGNISRGLKLLARDFNIPVIALSQLNRSLESRANKRPTLADLRQSGAIEQDADMVFFIYRDEVYNPQLDNRNQAEVIIAKNRNGEIGTVNLMFKGAYCKFDDYIAQQRYETIPVTKSRFNQFEY